MTATPGGRRKAEYVGATKTMNLNETQIWKSVRPLVS